MALDGEKGKTQGEVDKTFIDRLDDLQNIVAKACAEGFRTTGLRKWYLPTSWLATGMNLFAVDKFSEGAFDRTNLNNLYEKTLRSQEEAGTTGDTTSLKNQIDYIAMEERAMNLRHASPVRCLVYSQMRRYGHSVSNVFSTIVNQCTSTIQNGGQ